jgi:hypothetical protein
MNRNMIAAAWEQHCALDWPQFSSPHQGQLMTLDTVISGCVVYYLDSPGGLDGQRISIVKDCLEDLHDLTEELDADSQGYFLRLRQLGELLLTTETPS